MNKKHLRKSGVVMDDARHPEFHPPQHRVEKANASREQERLCEIANRLNDLTDGEFSVTYDPSLGISGRYRGDAVSAHYDLESETPLEQQYIEELLRIGDVFYELAHRVAMWESYKIKTKGDFEFIESEEVED